MEPEALRLLIRKKLHSGRLPYDNIPRFWGGPSNGEVCDVCEIVIVDTVMEGISSQTTGRRPLQLHILCFAVWDEVRSEPKL